MKVRRHMLKKGCISLIVAPKPKSNKVEMSSINVNSAFVLSGNVQILHDGIAKIITEEEGYIYLIGHGGLNTKSINKSTINGRKIKEISNLLLKAGYNGKQTIFVTSCNSNTKVKGVTMVDVLFDELSKHLNLPKEKLISKSDGLSVIVEEGNKSFLYVIKTQTRFDKFRIILQSLIQLIKDKNIKLDLKSVNTNLTLAYYNIKYKNKIDTYKHKLITNFTKKH